MGKIKDKLYTISAKTTALALIIAFMGVCFAGAIGAIKLVLRLIGVI